MRMPSLEHVDQDVDDELDDEEDEGRQLNIHIQN
jgi:hypothetical protein